MYSRAAAAQSSGSSAIDLLNRPVCTCLTCWLPVPCVQCMYSSQCPSGARLTGWQCALSTAVSAKQADRHWRHTVGHCGTVIQRAQTASQSGAHSGAHWGIINCTFRGHRQPDIQGDILGHWSIINCTYRGHRQPDRQGSRHSGAHWGIINYT